MNHKSFSAMDPEKISEELFDEYIEFDEEKENQPNNAEINKQSRVTKAQYEKMDQFHKGKNRFYCW